MLLHWLAMITKTLFEQIFRFVDRNSRSVDRNYILLNEIRTEAVWCLSRSVMTTRSFQMICGNNLHNFLGNPLVCWQKLILVDRNSHLLKEIQSVNVWVPVTLRYDILQVIWSEQVIITQRGRHQMYIDRISFNRPEFLSTNTISVNKTVPEIPQSICEAFLQII